MKKLIAILSLFLFSAAIVGCNNDAAACDCKDCPWCPVASVDNCDCGEGCECEGCQ